MARSILVVLFMVVSGCGSWNCAGTRVLVNGIDLTPDTGTTFRGSVYVDGDPIPVRTDDPRLPTAVAEAGRFRSFGWGR